MKRTLFALLLICLLLPAAAAFAEEPAEEPARYTAITVKAAELKQEAGRSRTLRTIRTDAKVDVLEYGEPWCRVRYREQTGYVRTKYLWGFVSLDAKNWPSPQFTPCAGYVTLETETLIKGGKFSGLTAAAGSRVAVYGEDLSLPVWRGSATLPADARCAPSARTPRWRCWNTATPGAASGIKKRPAMSGQNTCGASCPSTR